MIGLERSLITNLFTDRKGRKGQLNCGLIELTRIWAHRLNRLNGTGAKEANFLSRNGNVQSIDLNLNLAQQEKTPSFQQSQCPSILKVELTNGLFVKSIPIRLEIIRWNQLCFGIIGKWNSQLLEYHQCRSNDSNQTGKQRRNENMEDSTKEPVPRQSTTSNIN